MPRLLLLCLNFVIVLFLVTACSLPRGEALQSEILSNANDENPDMAVYSVTKDLLPTLAT